MTGSIPKRVSMRRAIRARALGAHLVAAWLASAAIAFAAAAGGQPVATAAALSGLQEPRELSAESSAAVESSSRRLVLMGIETGMIHVDIPHPEQRGESFGARFRLGVQVGYEISSRLAVDAGMGFSFLGESDSLNALLVSQGRAEGAAYTLVDATIGLTGRWPLGGGRWAPFARAGGGLASFALSWPDGGTRSTDPLWTAGAGLEVGLARPVLLRLQGRWMGQGADGTSLHHVTAELAVFYALYSGSFADETPQAAPP